MNDNHHLYDKHGIPILPGDVLKIFHYTSRQRRERRYMYKWVATITRSKKVTTPMLKVSHLTLKEGFYWISMNGEILENVEIVQGYQGVKAGQDFRDRSKCPKVRLLKKLGRQWHSPSPYSFGSILSFR